MAKFMGQRTDAVHPAQWESNESIVEPNQQKSQSSTTGFSLSIQLGAIMPNLLAISFCEESGVAVPNQIADQDQQHHHRK